MNKPVFRQNVRNMPAELVARHAHGLNEPPVVVERVINGSYIYHRIIGVVAEHVALLVQHIHVRLGNFALFGKRNAHIAAHNGGKFAGNAHIQSFYFSARIGFRVVNGMSYRITELVRLKPFAIGKTGVIAFAHAVYANCIVDSALAD